MFCCSSANEALCSHQSGIDCGTDHCLWSAETETSVVVCFFSGTNHCVTGLCSSGHQESKKAQKPISLTLGGQMKI